MSPLDELAIARTLRFIGRCFPIVTVLCAISAVARFIQTGWPSLSGALSQVGLEIVVEGARVLLALAAIGRGNPFTGVQTIKRFLGTHRANRSLRSADIGKRLPLKWKSYAWDFGLYCGIAVALNLMISVLVEIPAVIGSTRILGAEGSDSAALFLKNLSVIPFTIVFQVFFVSRLWNQLRNAGKAATAAENSHTRPIR